MLNQPTLEKLQTMKLHGMADAFRGQVEITDTGHLSFEERFAMLVDQAESLWPRTDARDRGVILKRMRRPQSELQEVFGCDSVTIRGSMRSMVLASESRARYKWVHLPATQTYVSSTRQDQFGRRGALENTFDLTAVQFRAAVGRVR